MTRKLFSAFSVVLLVPAMVMAFASHAAAQKNELTGIIGRTFVSDQGVTGAVGTDNILHSGKGITLEANYGHRLMDLGIASLTFEVPFVIDFKQDVDFNLNVVPKDYKAFYLTPAIRANLFPHGGLSPWVSVGGGFGHFTESSTLEFGGPNPGQTGTTSGVFQAGLGLDIHLLPILSVRGEVRDFYSGVPQLNVDTGKSRQHNYFVGGGVVLHF